MRRVAIEINTDEKCSYGCGNAAKYINGSKRLMCDTRSTKCPAVRKRNQETLLNKYKTGTLTPRTVVYAGLSDEVKQRMAWNRGVLTADVTYGGKGSHKKILIVERGHRCEGCRNTEWLGNPITLELEHTDGDKKNNVRENLRLLCPNCHSYTPTWRRSKASIRRKTGS